MPVPKAWMAASMGVLGVLLVGGWIFRERRLEQEAARLPAPALAVALAALMGATWLWGGPGRAFIYFQF